MASIPSGSDPLSLLPPLADVLASSRDAEPSEESNSTLETLDSAYDEEALEKLSFLASITPDVMAHRDELSQIV